MENEETVVEDQVTEPQAAETDAGAQEPSIDDVLSEFDKEFSNDKKEPEQVDTDRLAQLEERLNFMENQSTNSDINSAVESISKEIDANVPKRALRGMLNDMAIEDPRLANAFANRYQDPKGWNKVLKAAAKSIQKEFSGLPDKQLTDDRAAVTAAVRGASKTTVEDEAPNFVGWSDSRFEHWKRTGKDNPNL